MPFGLHPMWAVAVVVIVLILFGVGRLPSVGGALGRGISEFRKSSRGDDTPTTPPTDSKKDKP
jgi:sec-independent protein translocase protein TatA